MRKTNVKTDRKQLQPKRRVGGGQSGKEKASAVSTVKPLHIHNTVLYRIVDKPENDMTSLEKMDVAKAGISKLDLEDLKEKTKLDYTKLAKVISVTRATLINKKGASKFSMSISESILGVADIYSYGYEVFEDIDRFNEWISRPNRALGYKAPYEIMDSQFGREEVKNLIGRIEYGVYS